MKNIRCFEVMLPWDNSERNLPATLTVECEHEVFDTDIGVLFQVVPGSGGWNQIEAITRFDLTQTRLDIHWRRTGGQGHRVWIPLTSDVDESDFLVTVTGPHHVVDSGIRERNFELEDEMSHTIESLCPMAAQMV